MRSPPAHVAFGLRRIESPDLSALGLVSVVPLRVWLLISKLQRRRLLPAEGGGDDGRTSAYYRDQLAWALINAVGWMTNEPLEKGFRIGALGMTSVW